jgi:predicted signal transduction protein with EAL and GGDEF domain
MPIRWAERVRQRVAENTFTFEGGTLQKTVSLGVASWPHPKIQGREGMLKAADDALYVAKEMGRNRVVRFDSAEFNEHIKAEEDADAAEQKGSSTNGAGSADSRVAAPGNPQ